MLSVVVAAWHGADELRACLTSLRPQAAAAGIEVVVARAFESGAAAALAELPGAVDVALPPGASVPALRAAGLARARGHAVAFIEDHCTCAPGWGDALLSAHREGHPAVGGPVAPGPELTPAAWAVYFYDYARYMPPCDAGPAPQLSGINMSFARELLDEGPDRTRTEIHEASLQRELRLRGIPLHLAPAALVTFQGRPTLRAAAVESRRLARTYAARRLPPGRPWLRAFLGLGTLGLPALLLARIVAAAQRKRLHRITLLACLPWLSVLLVCWSAGEFVGYVTGRAAGERG